MIIREHLMHAGVRATVPVEDLEARAGLGQRLWSLIGPRFNRVYDGLCPRLVEQLYGRISDHLIDEAQAP